MASTFEDHRGKIEDLIVTPLDAVTRIFSKDGAVRGNHFHAETIQWTYVLSGQLLIVTEKDGVRARHIYKPGELACEEPGVPHAWLAIGDTEVLVFTKGPRSGDAYESDTTRLAKPLIDPPDPHA